MENFKTIAGVAVLVLLLVTVPFTSQSQSGKTFIVNSLGDDADPDDQGTINWIVTGNEVRNGGTGGILEIKANGKKDFTDNLWEVHTEVGFQYVMDVASDVRATMQ